MRWQSIAFLPLFAQCLSGATLHLKVGDLTQPINFSDYLTDGSLHFRPGKAHFLLAFAAPVGQDQIDLLTQAGATVVAFIPDNSLMIAAPDTFDPTGLNIEFATRLRPEQKLSPVTTLTSIVEFHPDVDPADAAALLTANGLTILQHPDLAVNHFMVLGSTAGLEQWDEVDYIFPASPDLINGVHVYACATEVSGKAVTPMYVTVGHGWTADGLNGITLQYTFADLTPKVSSALTVQEITRALDQWPKYANVHFIPGLNPQAPATVAIKFAEYDHGDGYPFDGPGGILAHTFYPVPTNPEPIAGDIHLDGSENWNVGADTDIYTVVLHETGHALGLGHVTTVTALMYPYYRLGEELTSDDIAGVQALYGPPDGSQPTTPTPTAPITTIPPISLTIQNPSGVNLQTASTTEAISGSVSNAAGSPSVTWQTDHGQAGVATGSAAWSIAAVPLSTGENTITISAIDSNHQTATQALEITRTTAAVTAPPPPPPSTGPDTVPPMLSIQSPSSTIVQTSQSSITVTGVASDNVAVANVTWQNTILGSGTATGTTNWSASVPVYPGTNTLIIRAYDAAGNSSWRSITVVRN
jgi:hypothetical protein